MSEEEVMTVARALEKVHTFFRENEMGAEKEVKYAFEQRGSDGAIRFHFLTPSSRSSETLFCLHPSQKKLRSQEAPEDVFTVYASQVKGILCDIQRWVSSS